MKYDEIVRLRYQELANQKAAKDRGEDPRSIIPTGLKEYDRRLGIKRGIATLIGANSGEGKDLFMLQLMSAAAQGGYTVEVVAPEDPSARTADRSLSKLSDVNNAKMLNVEIDERELAKIQLAALEVEEWGGNIEYHERMMTIDEVIALMDASTADLRIINYWQLFQPRRGESLEEGIRRGAAEFNEIAKRDGCACVGFSQMNTRRLEDRGLERLQRSRWKNQDGPPDIEGFRPYGVSDLAHCTAAGIEAKDYQALFRPGRYLLREGYRCEDNVMEITRPKNNFGAEGRITVGVDLKTARFYDIEQKRKG